MGTLRTRPETGTLLLDFRDRGRRFRIETGRPDTVANRRTLSAVLARIKREQAQGTFDPALLSDHLGRSPRVKHQEPEGVSANSTFGAFSETWFGWQTPLWRPGTRSTVRITLDRHLLPTFGNRRLGSITRADVLAFRAALVQRAGRDPHSTLAPRTVNRHLGVLQTILRQAAEQVAMKNPAHGLRGLREPRSQVEPFGLDQVARIVAAAPAGYRDYLRVRFFTGLRCGEIDALQWTDIDFDRRVIQVRATLGRAGLQAPKSESSKREVTMSAPVREALARMAAATPDRTGSVFRTPAGTAIQADNFRRRVWAPLLARLGLPYRCPHFTRHTCASMWVAAGESPQWISRQLGHSTTELLFRVYSRFVPNLAQHDGQAIEQVLRSRLMLASPTRERTRPAGSAPAVTAASHQYSLLPEARA